MSAFIVGNESIAALAIEWGHRSTWMGIDLQEPVLEVAAELYSQNVKSVNYRYREETSTQMPDEIRSLLVNWRTKRRVSAVQGLKTIQCYKYQSCEDPEHEKSKAWRYLEKIQDGLINRLDGYEDAEWK